MKKSIICALIFIFLLIPSKIKAISIKDTNISGPDMSSTGKYFSLTFDINFSDIDKEKMDSLGIFALDYQIDFDDSILVLNNITSKGFDSDLYVYDGKYYVLSTINMDDPYNNKCADGFLFCSNYTATLNFYLVDTDKKDTTIKVNDIEVALYSVSDEEINIDNVSLIEGVSNKSKTLSLYKSSKITEKKPDDIVIKSEPKIDYEKILTQDRTISTRKSNINYLDSLTIENYPIEFLKSKNDYDIIVDDSVNELKINVKLSDSKATYKIVGADDLKSNNYKVTIEVTAENGDKNVYTINAKKEKEEETIEIDKPKIDNTEAKNEENHLVKIDKKYIKIGIIIISLIIFISIIVGIISFINGKKIDKELNKF